MKELSILSSPTTPTNSDKDFSKVLEKLNATPNINKKKSNDPRDVRLAAVSSALIETILDRRNSSMKNDSVDNYKDIIPFEIFGCALTALEGTIIRDEMQNDSQMLLEQQLPLLQILQLVIPFCVTPAVDDKSSKENAVFISQYKLLSRVLRSLKNYYKQNTTTSTSMETMDELGGVNAMLRHIITTSREAILAYNQCNNSSVMDTAKKLYHSCIIELLEDKRPKVRRTAQGAIMEFINTTTSGKSNWMEHSFLSYCIQCIQKQSTEHKSKPVMEEEMIKLTHLFNFLQSVLSITSTTNPLILQATEDIMKLSIVVLSQVQEEDQKEEYKVMLVNSCWNVILSLLDHEAQENEEIASFASKVLATLLQVPNGRPFPIISGSKGKNLCHVLFSRLIVSASIFLLSSKSQIQIMKQLLPTTFSILIHSCDYLTTDDEDNSTGDRDTLQSCISECQRLLSSISSKGTITTIWENDSQIEKQVQSLSIFLQIRFRTCFDIVLPCFATGLANILSSSSHATPACVKTILQEVVDMHHMVYDQNTKLSIENAIGLIIQCIGIQSFLSLVPLLSDGTHLICIPTKKRAWLLPVLKVHGSYTTSQTAPPKLSFFKEDILLLARKCDAATASVEKLTPLELSIEKRKCIELWSLFPTCFCTNYPSDVIDTFPALVNTMTKAIQDVRYPELVNIICTGIQALAKGASGKEDDMKCISTCTTKILPTLFKLVDNLSGATIAKPQEDKMEVDDTATKPNTEQETLQKNQYQLQYIIKAISELAKVTPKPFLQTLFQKLLQRLVVASTSISQQKPSTVDVYKITSLLTLSQALISSKALSNDCISLLYRSIKPCILSDDVKIQKKGYKVMADICQQYTQFLILEDEARKKDVMELLLGSIISCHVAARFWRLKCLLCLIEGFGDNDNPMDIIPQIMGEVILCLKDRNTKTRELAYQLITAMYYSIEEQTKEIKHQFFQVVTAGLAGQTPAMRSASVMALSRLIFETARSDDDIHELLPDLLSTVLLLLHKDLITSTSVKREEIKSCVSFIRVTVAAMSSEQLEPLLPDIISVLFQQQKKVKRFRSKIKIILQKLVKIYGYEKVTPMMPEEDLKLLEHLRKTQEKELKKKMNKNSDNMTTRTDADFDQLMDSEEERDDSDDDETTKYSKSTRYTKTVMDTKSRSTRHNLKDEYTKHNLKDKNFDKDEKSFKTTNAKTTATKKSTKSTKTLLLRNESNNDVHDLLHSNMSKNLQFIEENEGEYDDSDFDFDDDDDMDGNVLEFDDDGKMIIPDDTIEDTKTNENSDDDSEEKEHVPVKSRRISKHQNAKEAKQQKSLANKGKKGKKQENELGAAYKSKKSKGDVKKANQAYEPYAFVPLDSRNYSKKKRDMTVTQMSSVVRNNKRRRG